MVWTSISLPKNENGDILYDHIHPTETWLAMEKLVEKGLCKSIGLSNFNAAQIEDVVNRGKVLTVLVKKVQTKLFYITWELSNPNLLSKN